MSDRTRPRTAFFAAEGSSDAPLAEIVTRLFLDRGVRLRISAPDFTLLGERVGRDVASRVRAGCRLMQGRPDVIILHRDTDTADVAARQEEMRQALDACQLESHLVPVIPMRMTEAWLLLDEEAIRRAAGNPAGREPLHLPSAAEVERRADPKALLREVLLAASGERGRRRERVAKRFEQQRRLLLENLDCEGPVTRLSAWQQMLEGIDRVASDLRDS
ncbi:uncharacterized protein DUF4276 [Kineococcus xinjiangensis]|uniref:Uncharacterized protein DUF4276 n=1 Tax=Kineococcus xinjiangensis TaxID=512762 RepID=A0A2S6INU1_9ACTN|nr:DUF4276 family protein [Kineococcus xinjiangensis]PPK95932.1 uncharacterized protein DUF4276 [Kineococcus xinjiangensis]